MLRCRGPAARPLRRRWMWEELWRLGAPDLSHSSHQRDTCHRSIPCSGKFLHRCKRSLHLGMSYHSREVLCRPGQWLEIAPRSRRRELLRWQLLPVHLSSLELARHQGQVARRDLSSTDIEVLWRTRSHQRGGLGTCSRTGSSPSSTFEFSHRHSCNHRGQLS